ncbi:endonuclease III domain-containing protein [Aspergillus clavatus NRRL 1]|uniref:Helix-hairpin-helix motif protein n=1 Tax=Aspergillus clavatus (strain ATCC 1007 / CBS 513.65 / DSM 816 / NCTC 3887 / NRRL 1 / QM 1276 / 107) TaxID=344612 RepID=A1CMG4_ASPCL|nr:helix-hairpin-helix motif protein [Aspergillus clavatus NRRL 1]EAW08751.1 helix-hairpin-helix motif protein [Aspergillus clavatus NRRL 1]
MYARVTRSAAAREAALLAAEIQHAKPQLADSRAPSTQQKSTKSRAGGRNKRPEHPENAHQPPKRRKAKRPVSSLDVNDDIPHNLGSAVTVFQTLENINTGHGVAKKEPEIKAEDLDQLAGELQNSVDKAIEVKEKPAQQVKGKKKNTYGLTPGASPFPEWIQPTPEECEEVNRLLSTVHGLVNPPTKIPDPSLTVTGCGEVPSVLDALIRTLLSGATTGRNSALAFSGLVERFGILEDGIGKGSVNWDAVRQAPLKDVFEAIKRGGLADVKSKNLKAILDMVYEENQARRNILVEGEPGESANVKLKTEGAKEYEIACADQNFLSLNHLHHLSTEEAMTELVKYPGIGPKTAACVLLFCLQRPCFAVDTHIFRISKWLGWVPAGKATEVTAFSHLEVRIPDHLKYSLHQLFIRHGKTCPRCRAITGQSAAGWEDGCVIDHLVTRTGKRKEGNAPVPVTSGKKTGR